MKYVVLRPLEKDFFLWWCDRQCDNFDTDVANGEPIVLDDFPDQDQAGPPDHQPEESLGAEVGISVDGAVEEMPEDSVPAESLALPTESSQLDEAVNDSQPPPLPCASDSLTQDTCQETYQESK